MSITPTLPEALHRFVDAKLARVFTCLPGKVEEYDAEQHKGTVVPVVPITYQNSKGERVTEEIPAINDVPFIMLGSGGTRIKFPISSGEFVLILFSSSSMEKWITKGIDGDQGDDRHHSLNDAVAIPGLQPFLTAADASPQIEFTSTGEIHVGGSSALVTKAEFDAHTHTVPITGSAGTTPTSTIVIPITGTSVLKGG